MSCSCQSVSLERAAKILETMLKMLGVGFRDPGFRLYAWIFGANLNEIDPPDLKAYDSLGTFFYRRLKEGARPIDERAAIVSGAVPDYPINLMTPYGRSHRPTEPSCISEKSAALVSSRSRA